MENSVIKNYQVIKTIESYENTNLYVVKEIETNKRFALKELFLNTKTPFYDTSIEEFKKLAKKTASIDNKTNSPVILDIFTEKEKTYLLLKYIGEENLLRINSYNSTGKTLHNRYLAVKGIASGGFGRVYIVRDLSLPNKYWALKEMQEEWGTGEIIEQSFKIEAEMLSSLEHTGIPRITDFFVEEKKLYLVMDYVKGESLDKMLENLRKGEYFPEEKVINWGLSLCDILDYLHTRPRPVIFRDLKPDNIIITPEGNLKLIDFGIARVFQGPKAKTTKHVLLTEGYAPPEQWLGKAEPRSDTYALGATLFHLITGVHPREVAPCFPPPEEYNPNISSNFSKIITRALELKLNERFQSAKEFREELSNLNTLKKSDIYIERAKSHKQNRDYFNSRIEYIKSLELDKKNPEMLEAISKTIERMDLKCELPEKYDKNLSTNIIENSGEEKLKSQDAVINRENNYFQKVKNLIKSKPLLSGIITLVIIIVSIMALYKELIPQKYPYDNKNATGIIKGKILDSKTKEPLEGVSVILVGIEACKTEKDGLYSLNNVPPRKVNLTVSKKGYITQDLAVNMKEYTILNYHIELESSETANSENFHEEPTSLPEDSEKFLVFSEAIEGKGNICITVNPPEAAIYFEDTYIGTGTASMKNIPPGKYSVSASAPGYTYGKTIINVKKGLNPSVSLTIYRKPDKPIYKATDITPEITTETNLEEYIRRSYCEDYIKTIIIPLYQDKKYEEAIEECHNIIGKDKNYYVNYLCMANCLLAYNSVDDAKYYIDMAWKLEYNETGISYDQSQSKNLYDLYYSMGGKH